MTSEIRNQLRGQWEQIEIGPPARAAIHPRAGPHGSWLSLSLETPEGAPSWLYFCMNAGTLQYARVDDALPAEGLQWEDIGDESTLRATMQEFAEDFAASGSGEAGCASPPCSMPPVDE